MTLLHVDPVHTFKRSEWNEIANIPLRAQNFPDLESICIYCAYTTVAGSFQQRKT